MKGWLLNRNKSTRIIALMLAMIMMSAPFFAHAGLKGDSKAEEADTKRPYTINDIELTTNIAADNARITKDVNGNYTIGTSFTSKIYHFDPDYVSLIIDSTSVTNKINYGEVVDDNNLVPGKTLSAHFDGKIYYSVGLDGDKTELAGENKIIITKDNMSNYICFWLKSVVTDDEGVSDLYPTAYQEVCQVRFQDRDIDSLSLPAFTDSNGKLVDVNNYHKSVEIRRQASVNNGDTRIGNITFGYMDSDDNFTAVPNSEILNQTGTYTPCIRYSFSDSDVIKTIKGDPVKIDADAPEFSVFLIREDASGNTITKEITSLDAEEYINGNGSYSIKIVADDGTDGSGIDTTGSDISVGLASDVTIKPIADGKKATFEISVNSPQALCNYPIYDLVGNQSDSGSLMIYGDNTPPTIEDIHATVHNAKTNSNSNIENTNSYYNKDCDSLTLKATVTDDKALAKVYLYYKKPGAASYEKEDITTNKSGNVYSYVLSNENLKSGKYTFYLEAVDEAGNIATSNKKPFNVDKIPPEVGTPVYYYREHDGSDWGEWKEWKTNSRGHYVFNTALMDEGKIEYSVVVTPTDDFSGMKGYKLETGTGNIEKLDEDGFKVRYTFNQADLSNNTIVEVSFEDNAGNKTSSADNNNYVLTKDKIEIADTNIQILSGKLKIYETGKPENTLNLGDLTNDNIDINVAINKSYTISVEVVSGYEITDASLSAVLSDDTTDLSITG
ncbi:MAG: hypothetical protein K2H07_05515, partial [Lachnospiraceae bacterium]|nr:hypothetical protein [Lachnospiraceae bacterium]